MTSPSTSDRRVPLALAVALVGYAVFLALAGSHGAGGSDSAGYVGSARLLFHGQTAVPVRMPEGIALDRRTAAVFIPLGFAQGRVLGTMSPSYPVGFPLHMLLMALLAGERVGPFLVVPVASAVALALLYAMARELGLSQRGSLLGVALLAICPTWLLLSLQPMSDVPASTWALAALLLAMRAGRGDGHAAAAGFALGVAVIVRPSNALLALPLAAVLPWRWRRIVAFGLGGLPVLALLLTYNWLSYGSPLMSGYGPASQAHEMFQLGYFPVRFRHYGFWTCAALGPWIVAGWLASLAMRGIPSDTRLLLALWFLPAFLFHCFYMPYEPWWFTRFFLPGFPALIIGALLAAREIARHSSKRVSSGVMRAGLATSVALVLAWPTVASAKLDVLKIGYLESIYPEAVEWARSRVPERSIVLASQMSGAIFLYSDRIVANPGKLSERRLLKLREVSLAHGYDWYALMIPSEARALSQETDGRWVKVGEIRNVSLWKLEPSARRVGAGSTG